jgi:hypothetical protein
MSFCTIGDALPIEFRSERVRFLLRRRTRTKMSMQHAMSAKTPRTQMTAMAQWGKEEEEVLDWRPLPPVEVEPEPERVGEAPLDWEPAEAADAEEADAAEAEEAAETAAEDAEAREEEDMEAMIESAKVVSVRCRRSERKTQNNRSGKTHGWR